MGVSALCGVLNELQYRIANHKSLTCVVGVFRFRSIEEEPSADPICVEPNLILVVKSPLKCMGEGTVRLKVTM